MPESPTDHVTLSVKVTEVVPVPKPIASLRAIWRGEYELR